MNKSKWNNDKDVSIDTCQTTLCKHLKIPAISSFVLGHIVCMKWKTNAKKHPHHRSQPTWQPTYLR